MKPVARPPGGHRNRRRISPWTAVIAMLGLATGCRRWLEQGRQGRLISGPEESPDVCRSPSLEDGSHTPQRDAGIRHVIAVNTGADDAELAPAIERAQRQRAGELLARIQARLTENAR